MLCVAVFLASGKCIEDLFHVKGLTTVIFDLFVVLYLVTV